jgi:signal transduction histidine kinase
VVPQHESEARFLIAAAGERTTHPVRARLVKIAGSHWLLVGTDTSEMERALRRFGWASIWGVLAISLLIVLLGRWYAAQSARRVREFSATCDAIVHNDLSRRLDIRGTGDEFDLLGRTVNDMLGRLEQQATLLRTTYGSIAHDLRTPLYRLRVRMEEALRKPDVPAASREIVQPALTELDRVQRTLATLLRSRVPRAVVRWPAPSALILRSWCARCTSFTSPACRRRGWSCVWSLTARQFFTASGSCWRS